MSVAYSLPILTFHNIGTYRSSLTIDRSTFERLLAAMAEWGFTSVTLGDAVTEFKRSGRFPPRVFVITFDDGYQSVYRIGLPIMQRLGQTGTVFLTTGFCGSTVQWPNRTEETLPILSWEEAQGLADAGLEIGAHTVSHRPLDTLDADDVRQELRSSQQEIESRIGLSVRVFAYPFGRYTPAVRSTASTLFDAACSVRLGCAGPRSDLFALERVEVCYLLNHSVVPHLLRTPFFASYLRFRRLLASVGV